MRTIWKFPLVVCDRQLVSLPIGFEVLKVGVQAYDIHRGAHVCTPCLWCIVDSASALSHRAVRCFGTGHELDASATPETYIGTAQTGLTVWHFFWEKA
jgi:hypothetical protein